MTRLTRIIWNQVRAYRHRESQQKLEQQFDAHFGAFRHTFYRDAEWCAEVEPIYQRRLAESERLLYAPTVPGSMTRLADSLDARIPNVLALAWLYGEWCKHATAETYLRRALAMLQSAQGPHELDIACSISTALGNCLDAQGKFQEARVYYEWVQSTRKTL